MNTALKLLLTVLKTGNNGTSGIAPANTVLPAISGTPTVGQTLSVTTGTWTGTPTITYAYQWKRGGVAIGSATSSTYLLVNADVGTTITCTVTATNSVGSASATSAATAAIADTWQNYVTNSIAPPAWYQFRDSASPAVNSGSLGSAVDMTATNTTFNQTGKLGANQAVSLNGTTSLLTTANNATLAALTTWEMVFLVNPTNAGELSRGVFFYWGLSNEPFADFLASVGVLECRLFNTTPTEFATTTLSGISTSTWSLVFIAFDNAGDRKVHFRVGVSGAVSEPSYAAQPAMTGTYKAPTQALNLFNANNTAVTFNGLGDEVIIYAGNLTPTQRTRLVTLAGV